MTLTERWPVHAVYEARDGWLIESGDLRSTYDPAARPGLFEALCMQNEGDEQAAVKFAHEWGLPKRLPTETTDREQQSAYSLWHLWRQASRFRFAADLHIRLVKGNDEALRSLFKSLDIAPGSPLGDLMSQGGSMEANDPRRAARETIAWVLNEPLGELTHRLESDLSAFRPVAEDLVVYAARTFALHVTTSGEFRRCEECHQLFLVIDQRQRFCPSLGGKGESPCAVRNRKRRNRHATRSRRGSGQD